MSREEPQWAHLKDDATTAVWGLNMRKKGKGWCSSTEKGNLRGDTESYVIELDGSLEANGFDLEFYIEGNWDMDKLHRGWAVTGV